MKDERSFIWPTLVFGCALGYFLFLRYRVLENPAALYPWDVAWYRDIIENGYRFDGNLFRNQNVAFMPLYPSIAAFLKTLLRIQNTSIAMTAASSLLTYGTCLTFYRTVAFLHGRRVALSAVALFLAFPYSFFLFCGYAEPAFTLCTMLFFHALLVSRRLWMAATLASLSALAKQIGIVLIGLYLLFLLHCFCKDFSKKQSLGNNRWLQAFIKTFPTLWAGLAVWTLYLYIRFDDPLLFNNILVSWTMTTSPMSLSPSRLLDSLSNMLYSLIIAIQYGKDSVSFAYLLALGSFFCILWATIRKMNLYFVLYALLLFAFNVCFRPNTMNPDLGRYMLLNFPFFVSVPFVLDTLSGRNKYVYWIGLAFIVIFFMKYQQDFIELFYHSQWVS
uniref:Glycosyltransferase RgtA/B/C/D-like domain-containing protein n=1 Tax=Desulfacinum infernum TaxID=35837 RepID=A0A832A5U3_9BACT